MKPIYALHKDADGKVLSAASFGYSFQLNDWLKGLDVRAGDRVEFEEVARREIEAATEVDAPPALAEAA